VYEGTESTPLNQTGAECCDYKQKRVTICCEWHSNYALVFAISSISLRKSIKCASGNAGFGPYGF
jgi:hypothetical protein